MQRLQKARDKAEELSREKSRLTGELGALQTQLRDLESRCQVDFACTIADLPGFITQLETEAETAQVNAEIILGMRDGTVKQAEPAAPVAKQPERQASRAVPMSKRMGNSTVEEDGDGIP